MEPLQTFLKFDYELLIREHHLDTFGHVNNAMYLQILEEARWELLISRGLSIEDIQQAGIGPAILEINIKFISELRLRQKIRIETQMLSYEKKIGVLRQAIFNAENNLCCEAMFTFGLFDLKQRKLILPTPEWLRAIGIID